jgi:3-deoxy-D-manno-octulosonate 8-phosphate phosphatase KdsC-like HAD superfamily phosphatase
MQNVGFSACPADAVPRIKRHVNLVLQTKGGKGCVREFIDNYLLDQPV